MEIIPGVLEKDWRSIEKRLSTISTFSKFAHIDFIDGKFTENKTYLDPAPFKRYSKKLFLEAHLMVVNPQEYIEPLARAGFKRFIGHVERMPSQSDFVKHARKWGEVGLALDGPTDLDNLHIQPNELDCILIFTADHVGSSGQEFDFSRLEKIKKLREQFNISIEVDGGINKDTILKAKNAGATRFVSTGFLFSSKDPAFQYKTLLSRI